MHGKLDDLKSKIRWSITDPLEREIVLKQGTYEGHIDSDHEPKDAEYRMKLEDAAKRTLGNPRFIIKDKSGNGNLNYLDLVSVPADKRKMTLKLMKVVVKIQSDTSEVATWIA